MKYFFAPISLLFQKSDGKKKKVDAITKPYTFKQTQQEVGDDLVVWVLNLQAVQIV